MMKSSRDLFLPMAHSAYRRTFSMRFLEHWIDRRACRSHPSVPAGFGELRLRAPRLAGPLEGGQFSITLAARSEGGADVVAESNRRFVTGENDVTVDSFLP